MLTNWEKLDEKTKIKWKDKWQKNLFLNILIILIDPNQKKLSRIHHETVRGKKRSCVFLSSKCKYLDSTLHPTLDIKLVYKPKLTALITYLFVSIFAMFYFKNVPFIKRKIYFLYIEDMPGSECDLF